MKHAILILCLWLSWSSAAAQFRMIGTATWTTLTDSTYAATINFQPDLTNNGYLATQVVDGFRMFTGTEQVYTVDVNEMLSTFSSIVAVVTEYNGDHGIPIGQVMVYDPAGRATIPQAPYGNTGSTSQMQAAVDTYNARLVGTAGVDLSPYSTRAELSDSTAAIRSDFPVGGTDDQTIDTLSLSGTTLSVSLESDGEAAQTVDLSALAVIDSTRLTQDSILVYYQDGAEVGRDTIAGVGGGGGVADNLGNHTMTQNLQTNSNWISGDGGDKGISVDAAGKIGVGTLTPSYILDINSTDAVRLPVGATAQRPTGANGLLRYNSDLSRLEGYYNAEWKGLSSTLADISSNSTTTALSKYTMKSGVDVQFLQSNLTDNMLALDQSTGNVQIGGLAGFFAAAKLQIGSISGQNGGNIYTFNNASDPRFLFGASSSGGQYGGMYWDISERDIVLFNSAATPDAFRIDVDGNIGINVANPTASLHLPAGTATANTSPLKFTPGTNLTTPEAGAMEWDGTNLYITQTTGPTRKTIAYVDTDDGSASDTTDGSGDITVSHTLGSASITVTATTTGTTFYHVQVHTKTSTTFKIRFFDATGAAVTATAVAADWIAKLQ